MMREERTIKKIKKTTSSPDIETDAEEIVRKLQLPLNQRENIFDENPKLSRGINVEPSVFAQKAVFTVEDDG